MEDGGQSSFPNTGARTEDGGVSADNVNIWLGGIGFYDMSGKSVINAGGGGAGAGGAGGNGSPGSGTYVGGAPGPAASAYLLSSVGGGGQGHGTNGRAGTAHSGTMIGKGGDGEDPNNFVLNPGYGGNDGAVTFKYYGPA